MSSMNGRLSEELLQMIAANPKTFLRRSYRVEEQIKVKRTRLEHLRGVSVSITQALKPVAVYTGPGDKVGDSAIEMSMLTDEIEAEIAELIEVQCETACAIRTLLPDDTLRAIFEAYYLSRMRWEEIAYTFHYAYRWTMRLHRKGLKLMQSEAQKLIAPV